MDPKPYQPSEAWKKFHEKYKLLPPPIESNGEFYWGKMGREEEERERMNAEIERDFREMNTYEKCYDDEESIMNIIMDGEGDSLGY